MQLSVSQLSLEVVASGDELICHTGLRENRLLQMNEMQTESSSQLKVTGMISHHRSAEIKPNTSDLDETEMRRMQHEQVTGNLKCLVTNGD